MKEGPKETIAYWRTDDGPCCKRCADKAKRNSFAQVMLWNQEAAEEPMYCSRCGEAVGNRLTDQALKRIIGQISGYDPEEDNAEKLNSFTHGYAEDIENHTEVDLLLCHNRNAVCRSEPDIQRRLISDLNDCSCQGEASGSVRSVTEGYRIVAAPDIAKELKEQGHEVENLKNHASNIEKAIWAFAWENSCDTEARDLDETDEMEVRIRTRGTEKEVEQMRRVIRSVWRTMNGSASEAARKLAKNETNNNGIWINETWGCDNGDTILYAALDAPTEKDEREEAESYGEIPRWISDTIEGACGENGAEMTEIRTMHRDWGTWVNAEVQMETAKANDGQ